MLAEWVLRNYRQRYGRQPGERLAVLSSTVSSRMLEAIARKEGIHWAETLTGKLHVGGAWAGIHAPRCGKPPGPALCLVLMALARFCCRFQVAGQ